MQTTPLWRTARLLALTAILAGCAETPVELPSATTVDAGAATLALTAGDQTISLSPVVLDQRSRPLLPQPPLTYSSSNPVVALVSPGGGVTPLAVGTANVIVAFGGVADTVAVTVASPTFDITPSTAQSVWYNGQSVTLVATARTPSGRDLLLLNDSDVRWSLDRNVDASLSSTSGREVFITPSTVGTIRVFADYRGQRDTAVITSVASEANLLTALNIVQDSLPAIFSLMDQNDPALRFRVSATSAGGAERCQSLLNDSNLYRVIPRVTSVAYWNFTISSTCEVALFPSEVGTTWIVFEAGGLRDSVFLRSVPNVSAVQIVEDSVVIDQDNPSANQPVLTWRALDPRGQNQCSNSSVTGSMNAASRNGQVANNPSLLAACRLRIEPGSTGPDGIGTTFVTLQFSDLTGVSDSVRVRGTANALQFSNEGITAATSLNTLGLVAAGDTLRAGVARQVAMRVITRTGQPVAGARVTFSATATTPAPATSAAGTFSSATVLTDSAGVARTTFTPPAQLFPQISSAPGLTLPVTIAVSGTGPTGQSVASTAAAVSSASVRVYPGAPARLLVYRSNAGNAEDTTQVVSVDSLFVGQTSAQLRLRAYDANGNRIASTVVSSPLVTTTRPEGATVTLPTTTPDLAWGIGLSIPRDSTTATFTLGAATRTLAVRARPTTSIVARSGASTTNIILRSPYNDVGTPITTVYTTPGGQDVFLPAFTGVRDTIAFTAAYDEGGANVRGRTYLRPASGAAAGTPVTPATAITLGISSAYSLLSNSIAPITVGYPHASFAPATSDRGTVYFISDSVTTGVGAVYARTAGGTQSACIANLNPYVVPNGIAVNADGTQLVMTTHGRVDAGTGTDSTTRSQVLLYSLPGCTQIGTGPLTSNTSGDIIYRAPAWVGSMLVVERITATSAGNATRNFGTMNPTTGGFTVFSWAITGGAGVANFLPTLDPAPGGRVLLNAGAPAITFLDLVTGVVANPSPITAAVQQAAYGRR
jgi:hypothetical protein